MNCKSCGAMLEPGEKFCKLCGTPAPSDAPQAANSMVPPTGVTLANSESNNMGVDALVQPQPAPTPVQPAAPEVPAAPAAPVEPMAAPAQPMGQPVQPMAAPVQPVAPAVQPATPMQQPMAAPMGQPMMQQPAGQKKSSIGIIIVVALIAVVAVLAVIFLTKDKKTGDNPGDNSNSNEVVTTSATTKVKFNGFVYEVTDEYLYEIKDGSLYISDLQGTWAARIDMANASYDTVKAQRAQLRTNIAKYGYTVGQPEVKSYNGLEYVTLEAKSNSGTVGIYAYAKANNTTVYGIVAIAKTNTADYNILNHVSKILKTGKYEGGSNYIAGTTNQRATVGLTGIK